MVTSISSGVCREENVSGVPQPGQNVRVPWSDDRKRAGAPDRTRYSAVGTVTHATEGAALTLRQMLQWQLVSFDGSPPASKRTAPQKQPPFSILPASLQHAVGIGRAAGLGAAGAPLAKSACL